MNADVVKGRLPYTIWVKSAPPPKYAFQINMSNIFITNMFIILYGTYLYQKCVLCSSVM